MKLYFSPGVREKLRDKHGITEAQIMQAFANRERSYLIDDREEHRTNPPTRWFVAQTDYGIVLKVCFVFDPDAGVIDVKTAYKPKQKVVDLYERKAPLL